MDMPRFVLGLWLTMSILVVLQEQKAGLSQHTGDAEKASENVLSRSGSVGAEALLQLLKNYCRNLDIKTVSTSFPSSLAIMPC